MNCTRLEAAAEHLRERPDRQRLGEAGNALEQHVAAGEQRDEHPLEHRVLADDDALHLVERLLERRPGVVARLLGVRGHVGHGSVGLLVTSDEAAEEAQGGSGAQEQQQQRAARERRA